MKFDLGNVEVHKRKRGQFWQDDYDRCIRDSRDLRDTIEYVLNNPRPGWKFVASYLERIPT